MAQKKNKTEEVKAPPVISKLPIPISDSPLVIDLPDGQKLVVGRMIQGSVIEVATWRGTGRPDSRTSRLMLGMSVGDVNPTPEQKAAEEQANSAESTQRTSQISNPQLAKAQEIFWSITSHPIYKKLFGKPEPKKAKTPKVAAPAISSAASVEAVPVVTPVPDSGVSIPTEPVSPFNQGAAARPVKSSSGGLKRKLFGSPKKAKQVKAARSKNSATSWVTPTSSSVPTTSGADIDAWLEEISSKAKARVESKSAPAKSASKSSTTAKKTASAGKTAKKRSTVAKKAK